jgi:hypothetical protein
MGDHHKIEQHHKIENKNTKVVIGNVERLKKIWVEFLTIFEKYLYICGIAKFLGSENLLFQ